MTLGASFIWSGVGYSIQPTPGGASPAWLTAVTNWSIGSYVPTSVLLIAGVASIDALIDRSPLGVVLRGFGSNPAAMIASGWTPIRFSVIRHLIAGLFAAAAGLALTAINSSSDVNSGNSYTLLGIAAVVMGADRADRCACRRGIGRGDARIDRRVAGRARRQRGLERGRPGRGAHRTAGDASSRKWKGGRLMALDRFLAWAQFNRWTWSTLAVLAFWAALSLITDRFSVASLSSILISASFLSVVGIGQMVVVTTGRGSIDLSVASVITLSAYLALLTVRGQDANLAFGALVTLALGLAVGLFNAALVVRINIPAIIATLATGYVLAIATLLANRSIHGFDVSPDLKVVAGGRLQGVPIMLIFCVALIVVTE